MREETRRTLNRVAAGERWNTLLVGGLLTLAFGSFFVAGRVVLSDRETKGVGKWAVWKVNPDTGQRYPNIQVALPDGRLVRVGTLAPVLPQPGSEIVLRERSLLTAYKSYVWDGPKP